MKVILFANTDWYLFNFRLSLAKTLKAAGFDLLMVSPPGEYGKRLQSAGFRWEVLPMDRKSLNPLRELLLLNHLRRLYRKEKPNLVHHFTIKAVIYGGIAAALAGVSARVNAVAGLGYVFTNQALKARFLRPVVRLLMRWVVNNDKSRLILQNGDDVTSFELARIADFEHIRLIKGSGVDTIRFTPLTKSESFQGKSTRVLLAARLLWDKGIAEYVDAARQLRGRGLKIRFLLAGAPDPGNPASIAQAQLDEWSAEGIIELLGQVDDMRAQYAETDIFVLPSYREGLPKSLIEAAACGLPLVTTDVPGCREVVSNEVNGLVVPVRDADSLADAIQRLHENPEWALKLGMAARTRVLNEFDEKIVISKTLQVYQELLPQLSL